MKRIYNKFIAYELRRLGEKIAYVEPNFRNPILNIYVFYQSETIEDNMTIAINRYSQYKALKRKR